MLADTASLMVVVWLSCTADLADISVLARVASLAGISQLSDLAPTSMKAPPTIPKLATVAVLPAHSVTPLRPALVRFYRSQSVATRTRSVARVKPGEIRGFNPENWPIVPKFLRIEFSGAQRRRFRAKTIGTIVVASPTRAQRGHKHRGPTPTGSRTQRQNRKAPQQTTTPYCNQKLLASGSDAGPSCHRVEPLFEIKF